MFHVASDWNPKQQKLRNFLSSNATFEEAMQLCLELHGIVHSSFVSSVPGLSYLDEIYEGLSREIFHTALEQKNSFGRSATIAWNIWHITRIEDITTNILIDNDAQVLSEAWLKRLGVTVKDTGNAMSDEEILRFSHSLDPDNLTQTDKLEEHYKCFYSSRRAAAIFSA